MCTQSKNRKLDQENSQQGKKEIVGRLERIKEDSTDLTDLVLTDGFETVRNFPQRRERAG